MSIKFKFLILATSFLLSCQNTNNRISYKKGEYGYDLAFLQKYLKPIELVNGDSRLILDPKLQGRVFTSTSSGLRGFSNGWINYDLISSSKIQEHFNPYGGEERLWLGPEGGQFSIFYEKDSSFIIKHWFVPAAFDTEAFEIADRDSGSVTMTKEFELKNYSGTTFNGKVTRKITLLTSSKIGNLLGVEYDHSVHAIAYQSEDKLKNIGNNRWTKESGALSIWMLNMLNASTGVTVILPYKKGGLGKIVKDDYFIKVPDSRLKIGENAVFFRADGKFRSKIGISVLRSTPRIGSYDVRNKILTILEFSLPENVTDYVNSALEIQKEPFSGDVINSYNDGPTADGTQMGSFYELEISSPAAFLKPGEDLVHVQRIYHFEGNEDDLNLLAMSLLNVSLLEIKKAFKND